MSVACRRISNEPLSSIVVDNEEKTDVFNSLFDKPHGTSLHQITDKTQVVNPAVLENPINVGFPFQQLQEQYETAFTNPGAKRVELLSNDTMSGAFETSCGRATDDDWNTASDPRARLSEVDEYHASGNDYSCKC